MRRCVSYRTTRDRHGRSVRRCSQYAGAGSRFGGLSGVAELGQANSLRATFGDVKDVAMTASLGALGAIVTDIVYDQLSKNVDMLAGLTGYRRALAEAATGIAIGIVVGKFLKRPRLGATLATGPVVLAALRVAGEMLNAGPFKPGGSLADLGMMAIEPYRPELQGSHAPNNQLGAAWQVGKGTPSWMLTPEGSMAGVYGGY